jgi:signal transduction histidine kinase
VLNFGLSDATYWLRLRAKNARPDEARWLIELAYPLLDSIFFYQADPNGVWRETVSGELVGVEKMPVPYKHFLFPVSQPDTAVHTYYLRIRTQSASRFPLFVHHSARFFNEIAVEEVTFGIFYGAMLVMVLYNLFLFFALRERSYLFYCAFIFLNTCAQATFNGHIQLMNIAVAYANIWLLLAMLGTALFGLIFSITFLRTKYFSPVLHRLLVGCSVVVGFLWVLSVRLPYHVGAIAASVIFLIVPFLVWVSGFVAWRKGNSSARYFVIAWTLYLVSVTLISLRTLGVVSGSMPLELVMQVGSVLDAVLLSLALADRINVYRKERAQAQERALKASREQERWVQQQNVLLEKRVTERTEEVSAQHEELQLQQEVIEELNKQLINQNEALEEEVEKRTQALNQSNQQLVSQNKRLEQFASVTSHNLRGPIANILGLSNVFEQQDLSEFNQRCLSHLKKATVGLDIVIGDLNELLTYSNNLQQKTKPVYFEEILQQTIKTLSPIIMQEKAQIISDFKEADRVDAVATYVQNIFFQLLSNALKFRSHEVLPIIRIASKRAGQHTVVTISDNGLGVDIERHKDKLFMLYQRFHTHCEGRGLGLYTVKTQMEALGGNVQIESTVKEGTTFYLRFENSY